jgi:tetratricopeptide (TPR) repeat protein
MANAEVISKRRLLSTSILAGIIVVGLGGVVLLARWLEERRPKMESEVQQESLYLTGNALRRASLGFNGLVADWYWMRALQYVGGKILNAPRDVQLDNLAQLDLKLLAPLLDVATTLDPEFSEPYQYAAVVLPAIDEDEAIRITRKGIAANPNQWRLYQHLGYIYWQRGDYAAAGDAYEQGAKIPGAPAWMEAMKARMAAEGGSRNVAREIYTRMFEQATDSKIKEMARLRLLQLDSMDQRDVIRKLLAIYKNRVGKCPSSWRELEPLLRAARLPVANGTPVDPAGTPYLLMTDTCDVDLDLGSAIPYK